MATGTKEDFVIYHEQLQGGFVETLVQETDAFNAASRGAITMRPKRTQGDYDQENFFKTISGLVTRRVTTGTAATAAVADTELTQDEHVRVKLNRKIGPIANTRDSFRKISRDPQELSFIIGQMAAKAVAIDMLNAGIRAAVAAVAGTPALTHDDSGSSPGTISTANLIKALAKAGDSANDILVWIMHSGPFYQLVEAQAATPEVSNVAGAVVNSGLPVTLGRPTIVTDSPVLFTAGQSPNDTPRVLGLRANAIMLDESELTDMVTDVVTGQENIIQRVQGEFAYNVGVLGWKWDVANGLENPDDTALALSTNWDTTFTNDKSRAGVALVVASGE